MSGIKSNWNDPVGLKFQSNVNSAVASANKEADVIIGQVAHSVKALEDCKSELKELYNRLGAIDV